MRLPAGMFQIISIEVDIRQGLKLHAIGGSGIQPDVLFTKAAKLRIHLLGSSTFGKFNQRLGIMSVNISPITQPIDTL